MRFSTIAIASVIIGAISGAALPVASSLYELEVRAFDNVDDILELRSFEDIEDDLELRDFDDIEEAFERSFDDIDDFLEAREPAKEKPKVLMSGGAKKHMDNLGLHGKDRQKASKWHRGVVKKALASKGADTAQIKHLAHSQGSVDPRLHITAKLWNKDNKVIKSSYGTPPKKGDLHHIVVPPKAHVNTAYKAAVAKAGKKL
ncbi:hypothetical protein CPB83DRAFT_905446 [Crepidotus variabilis]|uniref:Uncharacterized protein n=1 Tax=Crepidotus variabilis TaxID=179855 RepID=A0A9P6JRD0_9AGAR|nr:hypothetical protein CPB83DRAFT_905446 [Crepidotus variabilis]